MGIYYATISTTVDLLVKVVVLDGEELTKEIIMDSARYVENHLESYTGYEHISEVTDESYNEVEFSDDH